MSNLTSGNYLPANTDVAIVLRYHVNSAAIDFERFYGGPIVYLTPSAINVNVNVNVNPPLEPDSRLAIMIDAESENSECCEELSIRRLSILCTICIFLVVFLVAGGSTWAIIHAKNEDSKNFT